MLNRTLEIILLEEAILLNISQLIIRDLLQISTVVNDAIVAAGSVSFLMRVREVVGLHIVLHDQVRSDLLLDLFPPESGVGRIPNLAVVLECCHL